MVLLSKFEQTNLSYRINQDESESAEVVDVDGSFLYKKHQRLTATGVSVAPLDPSQPLSGWESVTEANVKTLAKSVPKVTSGNIPCLCMYRHVSTFHVRLLYRFGLYLPCWSRGPLQDPGCIQSFVTGLYTLGVRATESA